MQPSNIKMIDIITVMRSLDKKLEVSINDDCTLLVSLSDRNVLRCACSNSLGKTIITFLDDTDTFNDLVMFCAKGYIDQVDEDGNISINLNGLNKTLSGVFSAMVNTIGSKQVRVFSDHIKHTGKPMVWMFGPVTVTLDITADGLSIVSDADEEECKYQTLRDDESLNELLVSISLCTGTLNPATNEIDYSHSEVFQKITATLQHIA